MTKQEAKNILRKAGFMNAEEYYSAADHELIVECQNPIKRITELVKVGIPSYKVKILLVIETDEPDYSK